MGALARIFRIWGLRFQDLRRCKSWMRFVPHLTLLLVLLLAPAASAAEVRPLAQRSIAPALFSAPSHPEHMRAAANADIGPSTNTTPVTPWCGQERSTDN